MKTELTFAVETITPELAAEYLGKNTRNRRRIRNTVKKYADIMRNGEWMLNGEAIKFSRDGELLDGQHRLQAIISAETAIDMCVIRGLETEAFKTMDGCKLRSQGDYLHVLGYKYTVPMATAARILYTFERGHSGPIKSFRNITNDQLLSAIKRHPGFAPAAYRYMREPLFNNLVPQSAGMFCYYVASETDTDKALEFFSALAADDYRPRTDTDPVHILRETLISRAAEIIKPTSLEKMSWLVEAWNHYLQGKPLTRLSRIVDHMPKFWRNPIPLVRNR